VCDDKSTRRGTLFCVVVQVQGVYYRYQNDENLVAARHVGVDRCVLLVVVLERVKR